MKNQNEEKEISKSTENNTEKNIEKDSSKKEKAAAAKSVRRKKQSAKAAHAKEDIQSFFMTLFDVVFAVSMNFCRTMWITIKRTYKMLLQILKTFYDKYLSKVTVPIARWLVSLFAPLEKVFLFLKEEIFSIGRFWRDVWHVLKGGFTKRKKANFFVRIGDTIVAFFKGVKQNAHVFVTVANWCLPILAVGVLWGVISYASNLNYAVSVSYNGEKIGYIADETVYQAAEARLQARMVYQSADEKIDVTPRFNLEITTKDNLKSDIDLTNTIIEVSGSDIIEATGLTIDGKFYGAVKDKSKIQEYLDSLLDKYKTENPDATVQFTQDVALDAGLYVASNITDEQKILTTLQGKTKGDSYYTIQAGDTPSGIASSNGISLAELVRLNPNVLTDCVPGHQLLIQTSKSFLSVSVVKTESYTQAIGYSTEYVDDASLYKGTTKVAQQGENGERHLVADVEYVDGIEVSRKITSSEVTKEPVTKKIRRGTKQMPTISGNIGSVSDIGLCLPVRGGYISEYFGWTGSRYHRGLDIAFRGNGYGKPIVASHAGVVTYAGWRGSYGNLVIVTDSASGVQTWYAHCSKLGVRTGQSVARGQYIGNIGSTGYSTGNHLHIRILLNGVEVNPKKYLPPIS